MSMIMERYEDRLSRWLGNHQGCDLFCVQLAVDNRLIVRQVQCDPR